MSSPSREIFKNVKPLINVYDCKTLKKNHEGAEKLNIVFEFRPCEAGVSRSENEQNNSLVNENCKLADKHYLSENTLTATYGLTKMAFRKPGTTTRDSHSLIKTLLTRMFCTRDQQSPLTVQWFA